jgi:hypothetical protein
VEQPVPFAWKQAPIPLQVVLPGHSLFGSVLAGTSVQLPTEPARSQASQVSSHASLQQTPSTQKLLEHWSSAVQA